MDIIQQNAVQAKPNWMNFAGNAIGDLGKVIGAYYANKPEMGGPPTKDIVGGPIAEQGGPPTSDIVGGALPQPANAPSLPAALPQPADAVSLPGALFGSSAFGGQGFAAPQLGPIAQHMYSSGFFPTLLR